MEQRNVRWHQMSAEATAAELHTDAACGLSRKAACSRLKKFGSNTLFEGSGKPTEGEELRGIWKDPAVLLFLLSALFSSIFGEFSPVIAAAVLLVGCLGMVLRSIRRQKLLQTAKAWQRVPTVCVIRDGKRLRIPAEQVVVGDLLLLRRGDVVPCDCRLVFSEQLRIMTLLPDSHGNPTWKLLPKRAEAVYPYGTTVEAPDFENMIYGGSELYGGEATAIAVRTGKNTFLGSMESFSLPAEAVGKRTDFSESVLSFLKFYGWVMLGWLLVTSVASVLTSPAGRSVFSVFFAVAAVTAAACPVLLRLYLRAPVRSAVHRCCSGGRQNRALIRSVRAKERLPDTKELFVIGHGGTSDGCLHLQGCITGKGNWDRTAPEHSDPSVLSPLCEAYHILESSSAFLPEKGERGNAEKSVFLREMTAECGYDIAALRIRLIRAFRTSRPEDVLQTVEVQTRTGNYRLLFAEGGELANICTTYTDVSRICAISPELREALRAFCRRARETAQKVYCVARQDKEGDPVFVGMFRCGESVLPDCTGLLAKARKNGIRVTFFLTGDPEEEQSYARTCGLPGSCSVCSSPTEPIVAERLEQNRVWIGYSEPQLHALFRTLRMQKHPFSVLLNDAEYQPLMRFASTVITCVPADADPCHPSAIASEEVLLEETGASEVIRRHGDLLVCRAGEKGGGIASVFRAVGVLRDAAVRYRMLLSFLLTSQAARLIAVTLAALSGIALPTAVQILFSGIFTELVGTRLFLSVPLSEGGFPQKAAKPVAVPDRITFCRRLMVPVLASVILPAILTVILGATGAFAMGEATTYLLLSLLLSQAAALLLTLHLFGVPQAARRWMIAGAVILFPAAIATALSIAFPAVQTVLGAAGGSILSLALLPLSPLTVVLCYFLPSIFARTAK